MPVSSIVVQADRRTYNTWSRALKNLSQPLDIDLIPVGNQGALPPFPKKITFFGRELLLDVGRACSRPHRTDDPERLFALLRYATKISGNSQGMSLSTDVADLDPHKKKVLSDEIGCGFSFLVCSRILNTDFYLDLSEAIRRGWVTTSAAKTKLPDYIGLGTSNDLVVLEAKGSQSTAYCRSQQIPRGCQQVRAVGSPGRQIAYRIVIGAGLQREDQGAKSRIYVGDPEERDAYPIRFDEPNETLILRSHYLRIASFIGDGQLIRSLGGADEEAFSPEAPPAREMDDGHTAFGSTFEIWHRSYKSGFFIGLDADLREFLLARHLDDLSRIVNRKMDSKHESEDGIHLSRRNDGTIMEVWSEINPIDRESTQ